ncbi:MAG: cytochrome b [Colwellia sp.]|nr:cytochrome b [Colwellia sp.]
MLKNTEEKYGVIGKTLHWISALTVIGLFVVGYWMVDLTYYSEWYKTAPLWHKSVGILLLMATLFRLFWRFYSPAPKAIASHSKQVKLASSLAHAAIYILLFLLMISGYLISTADGRGIAVFNWFSVPTFGKIFSDQADIAGLIHEYFAYALIGLSLLHAVAAVKHHVIDKDDTLKRMTRKKQ